MDFLAKFEARPIAQERSGPVVVKIKSTKTVRDETSVPGASASATLAATPTTTKPARQLVIEKSYQPGFDIDSFLNDLMPSAQAPAPAAKPTAEPTAEPTPAPKPTPTRLAIDETTVAPTSAPDAAPDAATAATPAATPAKKRKRKIVIYKTEEEALKAQEEAKAKTKQPKARARSGQKSAKLVSAVALLDEIKAHGLPGSRNPPPRLIASEYYLNNRQGFVSAIAKLFDPIRKELAKQKPPTCEDKVGNFGLLPQQEIVLNYLNNYTPYRGLLLYHGLGSGKTCAAISAAEGMMSERPVYIMTPASLRKNFIEEIKFCGAPAYSRDQHWRFIEAAPRTAKAKVLAQVNGLPQAYVNSKRGAWVIDTRKEPNWASLSDSERSSLDDQLTLAITEKYTVVHYNGIRRDGFNRLKREAKTKRGVDNPFTGAVVVLEEAHNFVGMIVNKLKSKSSLSMDLYNLLIINCYGIKIKTIS